MTEIIQIDRSCIIQQPDTFLPNKFRDSLISQNYEYLRTAQI